MASLIQYTDELNSVFRYDNLMLNAIAKTRLDDNPRFESQGAVIQVRPKANTTSSDEVGVTFNAFPNLQCIANGLPNWYIFKHVLINNYKYYLDCRGPFAA